MRVVYGKELTIDDIKTIENISKNCGILFDTARLLFYRGIETIEQAKRYLKPNKKHLHDPFLFNNMESAVNRIKSARDLGETVLVYGDYDADGICATCILTKALKNYGINVISTIPEREEGYGLNLERIENLSSDNLIDLIITVDCGISEHDKVSELMDLGIDVIITDHHEPPEILPDTLIINPKVKEENYPFKGLCGAGVAYKLAYALIGDLADKYLDLVALATIADSMDLINENRDIVFEGLKLVNSNNMRSAFKYLIGENTKQLSSQVLAYTIAPRINAGGRMGDAKSALDLFLTEDENEIFDYAVKLNEYNIQRQIECDKLYREAKKIIEEEKLYNNNVIVIGDANWKTGYTGIVAARLVEEYARPTIVFAGYEEDYKGSARSVPGINVHDAIGNVRDYVLVYGGHSQAAGVTVSKANFEIFKDKLNEEIYKLYPDYSSEKEILVDWELVKPLSIKFASEIDKMEPFGIGNKKPTFLINVGKIESKRLKANSPHFTFNTEFIEMLNFNGENDLFDLSLPMNKQIIFETNYSVFRDRPSVKGIVKKILVDYSLVTYFNERLFRSQLTNLLSENSVFNLSNLSNVSINREVFEEIFGYLSSLNNTLFEGSVEHVINNENLPFNNYQFIFCYEVFSELGFFKIDNGVLVRDYNVKSPLTNSKIYSRILIELNKL